VLVHLDGHPDLDWLPDETVARIAAAPPDELAELELHPYAMDGTTYERFGIWNFIYPAARMGIVREMVWVVPDGTLPDPGSVFQLAQTAILDKMQMITTEEAAGMIREGRTLRGTLLGLPVLICELADLPEIQEPVLLDLDIDYFTTRSALTQWVTERPWTTPDAVIDVLRRKGIRTDIATVSLSTIGGYVPSGSRWLGKAVRDRLRDPQRSYAQARNDRIEAEEAERSGDLERAALLHRRRVESDPEDAIAWLSLSRVHRQLGRGGEAADAMRQAVKLDPVLEHVDLIEADRLHINGQNRAALELYERYLERRPSPVFRPYALRRAAGCRMRAGDSDAAIALYESVLEIAPDHADSRLELGLLLRAKGRLQDALREFRLAREIIPERASYAMALGTTLLLAGKIEDGIIHLEDAAAMRPCWTHARGNLALALHRVGRYEEAATHVRASLVLRPRQPRLHHLAADLNQRGIEVVPVSTPTPN
jgi:tetratricopeptide (TPR) repeat protein